MWVLVPKCHTWSLTSGHTQVCVALGQSEVERHEGLSWAPGPIGWVIGWALVWALLAKSCLSLSFPIWKVGTEAEPA